MSLSLGTLAYGSAVVASFLWFTAAFRYFSFQHFAAAKVFVPPSSRDSPIFPTIAILTRFLGGMNAAFSILSVILLIVLISSSPLFESPLERALLLIVLGCAHLSQFIFNVPILIKGGRTGESYWDVMKGPMRFIFLMDLAQTVICFLCAGLVITQPG